MLFKIDENLHSDLAAVLLANGHDAMTVHEQNLRGSADGAVAEVCRREKRAILTLDLDFGNILRFPPADYSGIIVLRLVDQSRPATSVALQRILPLFTIEPLIGHLWIVDEMQVRVRR